MNMHVAVSRSDFQRVECNLVAVKEVSYLEVVAMFVFSEFFLLLWLLEHKWPLKCLNRTVKLTAL